jgi:hypothetical protein
MYNINNMYHNCRPHDKEIDRQVLTAEAAVIDSMLGHSMDSQFTTKILILSKPSYIGSFQWRNLHPGQDLVLGYITMSVRKNTDDELNANQI